VDGFSIRAEKLSKRYRIGARQSAFQYGSLRETVMETVRAGARRAAGAISGRGHGSAADSIWALDDVSFEIDRGEVVGIIGRNGAGKSTLLKVLSRITKPTRGFAELRGRVGSLLEVGTGFHPELTGRDNIFLSGAILGMRRADIARRFDDIVEFSGVSTFIDTPVKRYSSGMYVRLAFAVAAHLEPEILLVDEVLAVGDAEFQKKCLGKMQAVVSDGRTVLFVSHSMAAVKGLCRRGLWIDQGRLAADGPVDDVVDRYLSKGAETARDGVIPTDATRIGTGTARCRTVGIHDLADRPLSQLYLGQPFRIVLGFDVERPIADALVEVGVSTRDGTRVLTAFSVDGGRQPMSLGVGRYTAAIDVDTVLLPRAYVVDLGLHHSGPGTTIDMVERALGFVVLNAAEKGGDRYVPGTVRGFVRTGVRWRVDRVEAPVEELS
jgi:lipopolysaccharide transport system ATP-binding protein